MVYKQLYYSMFSLVIYERKTETYCLDLLFTLKNLAFEL